MRFLVLLFFTLAVQARAEVDITPLLEDPQEFVQERTTNGMVFSVLWGSNSDTNDDSVFLKMREVWQNGLPFQSKAYADWTVAQEYAELDRDEEEPRPILLVSLNGVENPRFLRYKKNNWTVKRLRTLANENGTHYADRERMYRILADKYQVDAVENDPGEIVLLRPERFYLLPYGGTVFAYRKFDFGSLKSQSAQLKILYNARCAELLTTLPPGHGEL